YFKIWHRGFSTRVKARTFTLLLFGALALRFFQPQDVVRKRCFYKRTPKSWRPDGFLDPQCTPAIRRIQFFCAKVWRKIFSGQCDVVRTQHLPLENLSFSRGILVANYWRNMNQVLRKGPDA